MIEYFQTIRLVILISLISVLASCNNEPQEPSIILNDSPEAEGNLQLSEGKYDSLYSNWIIGDWRDDYSISTLFSFDSTSISYPDTDESYLYTLDGTSIEIVFSDEEIIAGEIDMPNDSTMILIFEGEMAVFTKIR